MTKHCVADANFVIASKLRKTILSVTVL